MGRRPERYAHEVWCSDCDVFHPVKGVEVIDYSSDAHERDQLVFKCPTSGKKQTARVIMR